MATKASSESLELIPGAVEHYDDADYYDFTYRRRTEDIEYYQRFVRQHGGPVLELGGGSGRVALALVRDGAEVTVLDASKPMLARAQVKANELLSASERKRLKLVHGDMRSFSFKQQFASILAPFNTLLHLYEPADFAACFSAIAAHLSKGGLFVSDVRMPNLSELARRPDRVYRARPFVHPTWGCKVQYQEQFNYDPIKQVQHVTIRFTREGDTRSVKTTVKAAAKTTTKKAVKSRAPKEQTILLSQRQIFPNEFRALLALGGLELAARHGDFSGRPLDPDDPQQIVIARRKQARVPFAQHND